MLGSAASTSRGFLAANRHGVSSARYDGHEWRVTSTLPGTRVNCLAVAPRNPGRVYAGTQGLGVQLSSDGGKSWQPSGLEGEVVKALAVSPHDDDTVYAGTRPAAVWLTTDGGSSWSELEGFRRSRRWYWLSPAEPPDWRAYVSALSVSPLDRNVVVAGIEAGAVVRSVDGGHSWSSHRRWADRDCHWLTFHASDGEWVYEAGGGGPAVSRDGGATWRRPTAGMSGRYSMSCAADPERPEIWYVSASPTFLLPRPWRMPIAHYDGEAHCSIYRSSGGGAWERLSGGLPQPLNHMAYALLTDPRHPGHLYAGLSSGAVWHSGDYGDSWGRLPLDLGGIHRSLVLV